MKATVDSKEFGLKLRLASKYARTTGLDISEHVVLYTENGFLFIRTTSLDSDCLLPVNAIDVAPGQIATRAAHLLRLVYDSGMVQLAVENNKLALHYDDTDITVATTATTLDDMPVMGSPERTVGIPKERLVMAARHTQSLDDCHHPLKAGIHLIPHDGNIAIVGTDGVRGYMSMVAGQIDRPTTIEAATLISALSAFADTAQIGIGDGDSDASRRIYVSDTNSPGQISFSEMASADPTALVAMFRYEVSEPVTVAGEALRHVGFLCRRAAGITDDAEIKIENDVHIIGEDIEMRSQFPKMPPMPFHCKQLAAVLPFLNGESYAVSVGSQGEVRFWYIESDSGVHLIAGTHTSTFSSL